MSEKVEDVLDEVVDEVVSLNEIIVVEGELVTEVYDYSEANALGLTMLCGVLSGLVLTFLLFEYFSRSGRLAF